jgi:lipopolysaccharide transport system permease protein
MRPVTSELPLIAVPSLGEDDSRPLHVIRPAKLSLDQMRRSVSALPRYWDLLVVLTQHRIRVRYKQSALGLLWAIIQPVAMMVTFAVVFTVFARVPSGGYPYALFAYAGLLPWTAFSSAVISASSSLVTHAPLVTRVYFPREILPLTYIAAAIFDLIISSSVLGGMLLYYRVPLTAAVFWVIPLLLVLAAFAVAVSLLLAALNVRYRDVSVAVPLMLQVWLFASPVLYSLDAVPASIRTWYVLNPMAGIVNGFRRAVLSGLAPDAAALGTAVLITALLLPIAYAVFKHVEATMADVI